MEKLIDLGTIIESGINKLEENFSGLWGAIDDIISWTVHSMNDVLLGIPFYIIIEFVALGAYYANAGKNAFKIEGLKKGALTEEQVEEKFNAWLNEKEAKLTGNVEALAKIAADAKAEAIARDKETSAKRAEDIAAKNTPQVVAEEAPAEDAQAAAPEASEEAAE